ncbi:MAG: O-antigen ligase family protein [Candidatus Geothermincolia bacterium]
MLKILCFILVFFSLAQPAQLMGGGESNRVFFVLVSFALAGFVPSLLPSGEGIQKIPQNRIIVGLLITYTVSTAQYYWLPGTFDVFVFWMKKVVLFVLLANVLRDRIDMRRFLWAVILATALLTFLGWRMYFTQPWLMHDEGRLQSVGNYNLSNSFALLLSVSFPLAFALLEVERRVIKKLLLVGFLVVTMISVLYTRSRGGTLGAMTAIMLCIFFSRSILRTKARKIIVAGSLFAVFLVVGTTIVLTRNDVTSFSGNDSSAGDRLLAWKAAGKMFLDRPFTGVGWGLFSEKVRDYGHNKKIIAHNTPLSVLAETGLFGFLLFTALIVVNLRELITMARVWERDPKRWEDAVIARGALCAILTFLVNSSFSTKDHDPVYWAVITLAGTLSAMRAREVSALAAGDEHEMQRA